MRLIFVSSGLLLAISVASAQDLPTPQGLVPQGVPTPQITPPPAPTLGPVLTAESNSDEPTVALDELVRRALDTNLSLQIARENLDAARNRASSARSALGPTLQLVPGVGGNQTARDEQITLAQPLDVFGARRARAKVGTLEVRRADAENRLAVRVLETEVKTAAALLFAAQESENLERVQVEVAQLFRDAAFKRATLGDVPGVQVQRADLELLRSQNDLAQAHATRLTRRTAVNVLIGALPDAPLRVALPLDVGELAVPSGNASISTSIANAVQPAEVAPATATPSTSATAGGELVAPDAVPTLGALTARPDIATAQATLEVRQAEVGALRRELLPQFELQARRAPFFGRDGGATAFRAVVTVPLFDFGALKGLRRAAEAEARAQAARVNLLGQQAAAQVESARVQLQNRRETSLRYRKQILPLTLDLLRKTQIGYAQGASTYLEVLEAQRTLRQVQSEYLQALIGAQNAETTLDAALNGGLPLLNPLFENTVAQGGLR